MWIEAPICASCASWGKSPLWSMIQVHLLSSYLFTWGRRGKGSPRWLWKASQESNFFSMDENHFVKKNKWFLRKTLKFKIFDWKKKSWNKSIKLFLIWKIRDTSHRYIACDNSYIVPKKIKKWNGSLLGNNNGQAHV